MSKIPSLQHISQPLGFSLQWLHRVSWCYTMQFFLQLVRNVGKRRHGTRCNYELQLSMYSNKFHAIVAESRTELYCVQLLQAYKSCETSCKEGMLYAATHLQLFSQRHCNLSYKENYANYLNYTPLVIELGSTCCNDYRDFFSHCKLQPEIATCNMSPATCNGFFFQRCETSWKNNYIV